MQFLVQQFTTWMYTKTSVKTNVQLRNFQAWIIYLMVLLLKIIILGNSQLMQTLVAVQSGVTLEASSTKVSLTKSTKSTSIVNGIRVTYTAPADASADFADVNTLVDAGAFMQLPVHRGILFGAEAILKLTVEGISDAPKIIIKALGSSGVADPIDQRQSIGYKVDGFGLAIKRPEAICITYGIPKFAELAALTNRVIGGGDYTLMDGLVDDTAFANTIGEDGAGKLRVDSINLGGFPGEPNVAGTGEYPIFDAAVAYSAGDKVQYNLHAYVFTADHSAGVWIGTDVVMVYAILEDNPLIMVETILNQTYNN